MTNQIQTRKQINDRRKEMNLNEKESETDLTSCAEILSQVGEVLLYGSAEAEIPFLEANEMQMNQKSVRERERGKFTVCRREEEYPLLCMRPMVAAAVLGRMLLQLSVIRNLDEAEHVAPTVKIFHAGTALDSDGNFIATGGRVLGITAKGKDIEEAQDRAYQAVEEINWPEGFFRREEITDDENQGMM